MRLRLWGSRPTLLPKQHGAELVGLPGCEVNRGAVRRVVDLLGGVSLEDVLQVEKEDPQFQAAMLVCSAGGLRGAVATFLAALSAYRLRCPGEEYWRRFARHFVERSVSASPLEVVESFLLEDDCNSLLRDVKVRRVRKLSSYLDSVSNLIASCDFKKLWTLASKALGSDPESKTIVFAVKMGYYCGRAMGLCRGPLPADLPVPVDSRVARATLRLGLVSSTSIEEAMSKCRDAVITVWRIIGEAVGVPPIHIDALLWALQNPETFSRVRRVLISTQAVEALEKLYREIMTP